MNSNLLIKKAWINAVFFIRKRINGEYGETGIHVDATGISETDEPLGKRSVFWPWGIATNFTKQLINKRNFPLVKKDGRGIFHKHT